MRCPSQFCIWTSDSLLSFSATGLLLGCGLWCLLSAECSWEYVWSSVVETFWPRAANNTIQAMNLLCFNWRQFWTWLTNICEIEPVVLGSIGPDPRLQPLVDPALGLGRPGAASDGLVQPWHTPRALFLLYHDFYLNLNRQKSNELKNSLAGNLEWLSRHFLTWFKGWIFRLFVVFAKHRTRHVSGVPHHG